MLLEFAFTILFTKTLKIQRVAQVSFSEPVCLVYGNNTNSDTLFGQSYHRRDLQPDHPYFERVWIVCHKSGQTVSIAKKDVKLRMNNTNDWPEELNSFEAIRSSLVNFKSLVSSVSGTNQDSEEQVVTRKLYDPSHIVIGYRFAETLHVNSESMYVDFNSLNCVGRQGGVVAEPII